MRVRRNWGGWTWLFIGCLAVSQGRATAQSTGLEVGHALSVKEAETGWISLFDGKTPFGWDGAKVEGGRLAGGTTTTAFGDCEFRGDFERGDRIEVGDREVAVKPGVSSLPKTGGRGPIRLGEGVVARSIQVRPLQLESIFNGRDMEGWSRVTPTRRPRPGEGVTWSIAEGAIRAKGGPGALESRGQYADFVLQVVARTRRPHANGGVFFRNPPGQSMMGYEAQIYNVCEGDDPARPALYSTGAIDDRQNARRLVSRDGKPFLLTVVADGPHLATWVNGYQVVDWTDSRPRHETPRRGLRTDRGTIQLQAHDPMTDVDFRSIAVRELSGR